MSEIKSNSSADQRLVPKTIDYLMPKSEDQTREVLNQLSRGKYLSVSVEITGFDARNDQPRLIGLVTEKLSRPVLFDLAKVSETTKEGLSQLLGSDQIKVAFGWSYIASFLLNAGLSVKGPWFDAMLAAQLLKFGQTTAIPKFSALVSGLLDGDFGDVARKDNWGGPLTGEQLKIAAKRVWVLQPLREQLVGLLAKYYLLPVAKLEFDCLSAVVEMQTAGVKVARNKLLQLVKHLDEEESEHRSRLLDWIPEGVNINDRNIVREVLAENGIDIPNVSQWTLMTLGDHREMADSLLACRKIQVLKSNFLAKYLDAMDLRTSRIFPKWCQLGTSTGRFSCSSPPLQNIPKTDDLRGCFVPEEGCSFVFGDFSQIELRVAAELSGDRRMIQAFCDGRDLHRWTASLVTRKPLEEISPEERQAAKALNFGLLFGMSARSLQKDSLTKYGVKMTIRQAEMFRNKFLKAYPTLFDWIQRRATSRSCWAETLCGRKRRWEPGNRKPTAWINSPIQGTAADILKKAMGLLPGALNSYSARIVACIHDEIILEVDTVQAQEVALVLKEIMEEAGAVFLKKVPTIAEVRVASSFAG